LHQDKSLCKKLKSLLQSLQMKYFALTTTIEHAIHSFQYSLDLVSH
jgi:hypothetical protein